MLLWGLLAMTTLTACLNKSYVSKKNSRLSNIHRDLGVSALYKKQPHLALKELLEALRLNPKNVKAHYALAFVYQGRRMMDKAIEHYRIAINYNKDYSEAYNNLGVIYLERHQFGMAIKQFKKAISNILYTTPYLAQGNLGMAYYKLGNTKLAIKHLKTSVFQNPKYCVGHNSLGLVHYAIKKVDKAVKNFLKALEVCPQYVEAHYRLGLCYLKQRRRLLAIDSFNICHRLAPESHYSQKCLTYIKILK